MLNTELISITKTNKKGFTLAVPLLNPNLKKLYQPFNIQKSEHAFIQIDRHGLKKIKKFLHLIFL
jgi:hypothetical protein